MRGDAPLHGFDATIHTSQDYNEGAVDALAAEWIVRAPRSSLNPSSLLSLTTTAGVSLFGFYRAAKLSIGSPVSAGSYGIHLKDQPLPPGYRVPASSFAPHSANHCPIVDLNTAGELLVAIADFHSRCWE